MTEKRKSTSIRALEEIHGILKEKCCKTHGRVTKWGNPDQTCDQTDQRIALDMKKSEAIKKVSKEIEDYAVKKYPQHGIMIVPLCHRSEKGDDRLEIDLKMKEFPDAKQEIIAKAESDAAYTRDMKAIDDWYFKALQSVALKEELPEVPEFKRP